MAEQAGGVSRRKAVRWLSAGTTGAVLGAGFMTPAARGQQPAARPRTGRRSGAQRKGIYPSNVKAADAFYSPAILAQGRQTLFISGQGPDDYDADMETQIRQTLEKIGILLEEAGGSWGNVVIVRSFFVHLLRDLAAFRKVRQEFYVKPYPASTAVGTPELAIPGLEVEIEAVAVL